MERLRSPGLRPSPPNGSPSGMWRSKPQQVQGHRRSLPSQIALRTIWPGLSSGLTPGSHGQRPGVRDGLSKDRDRHPLNPFHLLHLPALRCPPFLVPGCERHSIHETLRCLPWPRNAMFQSCIQCGHQTHSVTKSAKKWKVAKGQPQLWSSHRQRQRGAHSGRLPGFSGNTTSWPGQARRTPTTRLH